MIFLLHHPRTGGSYFKSMVKALGIDITSSHGMNDDIPDDYETWTIIRDPVERAQSISRVRSQYKLKHDIFGDTEISSGMTRRMSGKRIDHVLFTDEFDSLFSGVEVSDRIINDFFPNNGRPWSPVEVDHNSKDSQTYHSYRAELMGCCGDRLKKAANGIAGLAKATVGADRPDVEVIESRRVICRKCEHAVRCKSNVRRFCHCKLCGCLLKAKTSLAKEVCPDGRW